MRVVYILGAILFVSCFGVGLGHSKRSRPHHKHHDDDYVDVPTDGVAVPVAVPCDGPVAVPTDVPVAIPADGPVAVPGDGPVAVPVDGPVAVPGDGPVAVPGDGPVAAPPIAPDSTPAVIVPGPAAGYRKETTDTVSNHTALDSTQTSTKDKVKVITKHKKDGTTVTIIKDKSKTKTNKDSLTDDYNQTNHTLTEGGVEDSTSLTTDHQHEVKETDVIKKTDRERIVTDKYGNVISDTHKTKEKEKVKKKEQDLQTESLVHTVKSVPPPVLAVDPTDAPAPEPTEPLSTGC